MSQANTIKDLVEYTRLLYERHLVHAECGNTSFRNGIEIWITRTGVVLGRVTQADLTRLTLTGERRNPANPAGEILDAQQGLVLREILRRAGVHRAAVAGGDTCGHVLKQLSVYALEFIRPLGVAAPLCRAGLSDPRIDSMQITLKGGQLGEVDFFGSVLRGKQD